MDLSHLTQHSPASRQSLQSVLIEVCRAACSDEQWDVLVHRAKRLKAEQEGSHG